MIHKKQFSFLLGAALLFPPLGAFAENLLPNGRFDHGTAGYMLGDSCRFQLEPHTITKFGDLGNTLNFSAIPERFTALYLPGVIFRKGVTYELSFTAKCSSGTVPLMISEYNECNARTASWGMKGVRLTTKYQRFTYQFRPDEFPPWKKSRFAKGADTGHGGFRIIKARNTHSQTVSISIADLYLGPAGGTNVPRQLSAAFVFDRIDLRFLRGETYRFPIDVLNRTEKKQSGKLSWKLISAIEEGKVLAAGDSDLILPPGKSIHQLELKLPERNGLFHLEATLNGEEVIAPVQFAIVPRVRVKPGELPVDLGVNSVEPADFPNEETVMGFWADAGLTSLRAWGSGIFAWKEIEPKDGKYDFSVVQKRIDAASRAGLQFLPVFGGMFFTTPASLAAGTAKCPEFPDWLSRKSALIDGPLDGFNAAGRRTLLPPMEDWERMIRRSAEAYRGRTTIFEIMNEPYSFLSAKEYLKYLKSAYRILKEVNPSCTVLGASLTGDLERNLTKDFKAMLDADPEMNCDAVSFHPYNNVFEDSFDSGEKMFSIFRQLLQKKGKRDFPLWNTELYYLNPTTRGGTDHVNGPIFHPGWLIRRYLLDAAQAVVVSNLVPQDQLLAPCINKNFLNHSGGFFTNRLLPNEKYIANAVFAKTFRGTRYVKCQEKPGEVRIYQFAGDKRAAAACFTMHVKAKDTRFVVLPKPEGSIVLLDVFGNPFEAASDGTFRLAASGIPFYVQADSQRELEQYLNKMSVGGVPHYYITPGRRVEFPTKSELYFEILPKKSGNPPSKNPPLKICAGMPQPATVNSGNVRNLASVPCGKITEFSVDGNVFPVTSSHGLVVPRMRKAPEMTGKNTDSGWNDAAKLRLSDTASANLGVFENNLYLRVSVKDTTPFRKENENLWKGDSVELFLDTEPFERLDYFRYRTPQTVQLIFAPPVRNLPAATEGGTSAYRRKIKRTFAVVHGGYVLMLQIPLNFPGMKLPGFIGFDFQVNDYDAAGVRHCYSWGKGAEKYRNRFQMNVLKLTK